MVPDASENTPSPAKLPIKRPKTLRKSRRTAQPKPNQEKSLKDYFSAAVGPIGAQARDGSRS